MPRPVYVFVCVCVQVGAISSSVVDWIRSSFLGSGEVSQRISGLLGEPRGSTKKVKKPARATETTFDCKNSAVHLLIFVSAVCLCCFIISPINHSAVRS